MPSVKVTSEYHATCNENERKYCRKKYKNSRCNLLNFDNRHMIGNMVHTCYYCGAKFWLDEKSLGNEVNLIFTTCCNKGKVVLPSMQLTSDIFMRLLTLSIPEGCGFHKNIRAYNAAFAFISLGIHIDESITEQWDNNLYYLHCTTNNHHGNFAKDVENCALLHLQSILRLQNHSFEEFPPMPLPSDILKEPDRLIREELNYDTHSLTQFCEINENNLNQD
ncbi:1080_t:CDS:2 [Cetraspora pellucida]|uniref:1080_t:CDS:1 n=1 Tax=Cetraspora pellucida TaxID=1433469 RepID=A0ACA9KAT3_9GLOM|nr:1080_t:CDS:2 [Cetraspora pellucida]